MEPLLEFLQGTGIIPLQRAVEIAAHFRQATLKKGEIFLKEGRIANQYMFLASGLMRAFAVDLDGEEVTTAFYAAPQVVFEVSSFFNRTPSGENIHAITDCSGWSTSFDQLNSLFHTMPEFREFGRHMLVRGYASLKDRMLATITESAEKRYENLLSRNPEILQHAQLKHIASYLGITDTSLSRIRKELSEKRGRH
jgi:CRP-like cAMP-binding protein